MPSTAQMTRSFWLLFVTEVTFTIAIPNTKALIKGNTDASLNYLRRLDTSKTWAWRLFKGIGFVLCTSTILPRPTSYLVVRDIAESAQRETEVSLTWWKIQHPCILKRLHQNMLQLVEQHRQKEIQQLSFDWQTLHYSDIYRYPWQ